MRVLRGKRSPAIAAGAVFGVGLALTIALWKVERGEEIANFQTVLNVRTHDLATYLQNIYQDSEDSLTRAAARWTVLRGTPMEAFVQDGREFIDDAREVKSVDWIDRDLKLRWHVTADAATTATNLSTPVDTKSQQFESITRSREENKATISSVYEAEDHRHYVYITAPVFVDGAFDGLISMSYDVDSLMTTAYIKSSTRGHLVLMDRNGNALELGAPPYGGMYSRSFPVELDDETFILRLYSTKAFFGAGSEVHSKVAVAFGLAVTLLAAAFVWLVLSRGRERELLAQREIELRDSKIQSLLQQSQIASTYDAVPVGLALVGTDGRYETLNERFAEVSAAAKTDHTGRLPTDVHAVVGEQIMEAVRYVLANWEPIEGREITRPDDDEDRTWLCSFHPVVDPVKSVSGVMCSAMEITALKEAERESVFLSMQLQQSQKVEALGRLTGGIAHDFNNMLGVIVGNLDFLHERHLDDTRSANLIARIAEAADRASDLIKRLLAFARQQPLSPRNVDVGVLVTDLKELLNRSLGENIVIEVRTAANLWTARVDSSQLEALVLNLAINAKDAMPTGGKLLIEVKNVELDDDYASSENEVTAGNYVMLCVSDTGTGMSPEVVARAFEPFFTTKEMGKGTGLGLSTAFGFAKQSGGHIKIYSEVGYGTAVKLYLPRATVQETAVGVTSLDIAPSGTETILFVEDNDMMREVTNSRLHALGYDVVSAVNAADALTTVTGDRKIDLLLTDVVMPGGMNGPDLAKIAVKHRPDLKILFISGYTASAISDQHGWPLTAANLLQKPFHKLDLAKKIREVLEA